VLRLTSARTSTLGERFFVMVASDIGTSFQKYIR